MSIPPPGEVVQSVNRILKELDVDCSAGARDGPEFYIRCRTPEGLVRVGYLSQTQVAGGRPQLRRAVRMVVGELMPAGWHTPTADRGGDSDPLGDV